MSLAIVLDVAIGLIFTYLLMGLIGSTVQEFVSMVCALRGRYLLKGLSQMLMDNGPELTNLFTKVSDHALMKLQGPDKKPSYISAANFTMALMHHLADGSSQPLFSQIENSVDKMVPCPVKESMTALLVDAEGDLEKLKTSIGTWFDDAMDRVSGSYKRFSHYLLLVFGLVSAVVFNVDSIQIASALWRDPSMRAIVVARAEAFPSTNGGPQIEDPANALQDLPVPIGWTTIRQQILKNEDQPRECVENEKSFAYRSRQADRNEKPARPISASSLFLSTVFANDGSGVIRILGWLITALATALGAPFWFDMLQNVLNLRTAGPKPQRTSSGPIQ